MNLKIKKSDVKYVISNQVYKITTKPIDLLEFAMNNWNTSLINLSSWRVTCRLQGGTMNIFVNKYRSTLILFTTCDIDVILQRIADKINRNVSDLTWTLTNQVIKLRFGVKDLDLFQIFKNNTTKRCDTDDDGTSFNHGDLTTSGVQSNVYDPSSFPAVIVKPFIGSRIALEIFESGVVNTCGIRDDSDIERTIDYVVATVNGITPTVVDSDDQLVLTM